MWVLFAFIARFIEGTATLFDKRIIDKLYPNPSGYAFWLGILGIFSLVFLPFGFYLPSASILAPALVAGACFVFGMFLYFHGLSRSHASTVAVLLGALLPMATLVWSRMLLGISLEIFQWIAFILLLGGGTILFFSEPHQLRWRIFILIIGAAVLIGLSNTIAKQIYLETNFATGFILIKFGGIIMALIFLLIPSLGEQIMQRPKNPAKTRLGYLANRAYAGAGSALLQYAIALGIPSLVDASFNVQLAVVLIGGWIFLKEQVQGWKLFWRITAIIIIGLGIFWLGIGQYLRVTTPNAARPITWGVTFSEKFAKQLGLDWKEAYRAILSDLGVKHIRLIAYWDDLEAKRAQFDFSDLDYQMDQAHSHGTNVILVVGQRVPRWPECHFPDWSMNLAQPERDAAFLDYMTAVLNHYRNHPALMYWQIENEPYLTFGICPLVDVILIDEEIALTKNKDPGHKILITDSGELGRWYWAAEQGDLFGTTLYRRVHNQIFGFIDYHVPPEFFRLKEKVTRIFIHDFKKRFIVIELATEPWLNRLLYETTPREQFAYFDFPFFQDTIRYAKLTGFDEFYLWGVEWWYWLKINQGHPEFWNFAKTLF